MSSVEEALFLILKPEVAIIVFIIGYLVLLQFSDKWKIKNKGSLDTIVLSFVIGFLISSFAVGLLFSLALLIDTIYPTYNPSLDSTVVAGLCAPLIILVEIYLINLMPKNKEKSSKFLQFIKRSLFVLAFALALLGAMLLYSFNIGTHKAEFGIAKIGNEFYVATIPKETIFVEYATVNISNEDENCSLTKRNYIVAVNAFMTEPNLTKIVDNSSIISRGGYCGFEINAEIKLLNQRMLEKVYANDGIIA